MKLAMLFSFSLLLCFSLNAECSNTTGGFNGDGCEVVGRVKKFSRIVARINQNVRWEGKSLY